MTGQGGNGAGDKRSGPGGGDGGQRDGRSGQERANLA